MPTEGIAVWALRRFVNDNKAALAGMSTGDVAFKLVKPATRAGKCAFVELLRGSLSDQGRPAFGRANIFLSHACGNSFEGLVDAVEAALRDEPEAFVWRAQPLSLPAPHPSSSAPPPRSTAQQRGSLLCAQRPPSACRPYRAPKTECDGFTTLRRYHGRPFCFQRSIRTMAKRQPALQCCSATIISPEAAAADERGRGWAVGWPATDLQRVARRPARCSRRLDIMTVNQHSAANCTPGGVVGDLACNCGSTRALPPKSWWTGAYKDVVKRVGCATCSLRLLHFHRSPLSTTRA